MDNREALLLGARACLSSKGYGRTRARDIAAAGGVSLAAIGYHFRSTEALLNEAVFQAIGEWGERLKQISAEVAQRDESARARFEAMWTHVVASFAEYRGALAASYELMVRAEQAPDVRERLASAIDEARQGLAGVFAGIDPAVEPERTRQLGSFYYALLSGLLTQWLVDPESAPSGNDLGVALDEVLATQRSPVLAGRDSDEISTRLRDSGPHAFARYEEPG